MVTMRSALGGAGLFGGRDHGRARRMRRHRVEGRRRSAGPARADVLDHVGLAVERAADHQERAGRRPAGPSVRRSPRMRGVRTRPHPWRRIPHALYARLSSPDILALLEPSRLAEENPDVMPEDDAQGMPVLYGRHASPFVRRVAVTLRLYGMAYRHVPLMPFGSDKAALSAFNPITRVPALQLGDGEMLIDSAAILDHLDQLAGPDALDPCRGACPPSGADTAGGGARRQRKTGRRALRAALPAAEAWHKPWLDTCDKQVRDGFQWLDGQFAGPRFTGAAMTQADVTVAVFWLFGRGKRPRFFASLGCSALEALADRLQDTPEFQATLPEPETLASELG